MSYTILNPTFIDSVSPAGFANWTVGTNNAWVPADVAPDDHGAVGLYSSSGSGTDNAIYQTGVFTDYADPFEHSITIECTLYSGGSGVKVFFGTTLVGTVNALGTFVFTGFAAGNDNLILEVLIGTTVVIDHVEVSDLTIDSEPLEWSPVYNPIQYTVTGINNTQCNYKYIADVYVDGTYITRLELFPDLTGSATFEFNRVLQPYVTYDLNTEKNGFNEAPNTYCSFQIKFGEQFDDSVACDSIIDVYTNLVISDTRYTWNGVLSYEDWSVYTNDTYKLNVTAVVPFLSHQPAITSINPGDYAQLMYIQDTDLTTSPVTYLADACRVFTYDSTDALVGEYEILNASSTQTNKVFTIGTGYQNIQEYVLGDPSSVVSGPISPFVDEVTYYTVQLYDNTLTTPSSELKTYKIDKSKTIDARRFVFLGELGNMDSYTFTRTESKISTVARNEFTKLNTSFTIRDRGRTVTDVDVTSRFTSNSGWLTVKESRWIAELFNSSEVYLLKSTPYYCYTSVLSISTRWNLYIAPNSIEDITDLENLVIFLIDNNNTVKDSGTNSANGYLLDTDISSATSTLTCGVFYDQDFVTEYTPIILTTNSYEEKIKRTTKNIQYRVDYELANAKQIQRN